ISARSADERLPGALGMGSETKRSAQAKNQLRIGHTVERNSSNVLVDQDALVAALSSSLLEPRRNECECDRARQSVPHQFGCAHLATPRPRGNGHRHATPVF